MSVRPSAPPGWTTSELGLPQYESSLRSPHTLPAAPGQPVTALSTVSKLVEVPHSVNCVATDRAPSVKTCAGLFESYLQGLTAGSSHESAYVGVCPDAPSRCSLTDTPAAAHWHAAPHGDGVAV